MGDESNSVSLFPEWRQAVKDFLAMNPAPGFILSKAWLMRAFEIAPPVTAEDQRHAEFKYFTSCLRFKACLLEEYFIDFKTIYGVGYEVLAPCEQTPHAMESRLQNIRGELRMLMRQVSHVRVDQLSDAERKENTDALEKVSSMRAMMLSQRRLT